MNGQQFYPGIYFPGLTTRQLNYAVRTGIKTTHDIHYVEAGLVTDLMNAKGIWEVRGRVPMEALNHEFVFIPVYCEQDSRVGHRYKRTESHTCFLFLQKDIETRKFQTLYIDNLNCKNSEPVETHLWKELLDRKKRLCGWVGKHLGVDIRLCIRYKLDDSLVIQRSCSILGFVLLRRLSEDKNRPSEASFQLIKLCIPEQEKIALVVMGYINECP